MIQSLRVFSWWYTYFTSKLPWMFIEVTMETIQITTLFKELADEKYLKYTFRIHLLVLFAFTKSRKDSSVPSKIHGKNWTFKYKIVRTNVKCGVHPLLRYISDKSWNISSIFCREKNKTIIVNTIFKSAIICAVAYKLFSTSVCMQFRMKFTLAITLARHYICSDDCEARCVDQLFHFCGIFVSWTETEPY